jgi:hypothetical protein
MARANAIIAGVNKAGTTSLFVSLSAHPKVAPASVKETRYFLPLRYGHPIGPASDYEQYFSRAGDRPVRLEATPSYFYGGDAVVSAMHDALGSPKIIVVLREPVSRFLSFFSYQKARLRIPETMTVEEYLATGDRLSDDDFLDADNERYFGFRGGCYADFLPAWTSGFGPDLLVAFFEDLVGDPERTMASVARHLGIDPGGFPTGGLASENRTAGYRNRGLQRLALAVNDRFEPFLRRHHGLEDRMRSVYFRVNGRSARRGVSPATRARLEKRYREANARLEEQLRAIGDVVPPAWVSGLRRGGRAVP